MADNLLSRDAILTADDLTTENVEVPEWGGSVCIRTLTAEERDDFEKSIAGEGDKRNLGNFRARLVSRCAVDDKGNRLFKEADVKKLGMKSGVALDRLFQVANRLSAISEDSVEELAEGLDDAQSDASTSG